MRLGGDEEVKGQDVPWRGTGTVIPSYDWRFIGSPLAECRYIFSEF